MSMYNFIDVNKVSEGVALPSEALKINGEFIENQIKGYRTLTVSGREALDPEVDTFETGIRNGSTLNYKRYPERIITVKYQLITENNKAFREAYNKLAGILNVTNAELIFNDEPDKFFIGTPSTIRSVDPGKNSVTGEFELLCTDPFKYSVTEYEVTPTVDDGRTFIVDYKGTHEAFPTFEVKFFEENETDGDNDTPLTGSGDCGFVAFFNEDEKIIQIGDPEETEGETFDKSQTLINQSFKKKNSWGSATQKLWKTKGVPICGNTAVFPGGLVEVEPAYANAPDGEYFLTPITHVTQGGWGGPAFARELPADATDDVGATNFTVSYSQKLAIGSGNNAEKEFGGFSVDLVNNNNGTRIAFARIDIIKSSTGKNGTLRVWVNNKMICDKTIDLSLNNKYFGNNAASKGIITNKTTTITKTGGQFKFNIGGVTVSYLDETLKNIPLNEVYFHLFRHESRAKLGFNGVYGVKVVKNNCDTWRDIPNKFSANDVAVIDCSKGEIFLNDLPTPELGALGNDWETFCLKPGVNQISATCSDWTPDEYAPKFKMRYREVFI